MRKRFAVTLAAAVLLAAQWGIAAQVATAPPAAGELRSAQLSWGSDPGKRCPDLRQSSAEQGAVAVVQFKVGPTGAPAQASIRSSSGSAGFDAAAVSCVLKLHFQPSIRFGDGVAVESWQQMALKSEGAGASAEAVAAQPSARCEPAGSHGTPDSGGAAGRGGQPGPLRTQAGVCVCVDETGKVTQQPVLTNPSGITGVDNAALELASAARYRPTTSASGQPAGGCFHFKVGIEAALP